MARYFPPRRPPSEPLPTPQLPTESQFAAITEKLGITPSHNMPRGRFADQMYYRGNIDQMIDAVSGPANTMDCEKYGITANEWHAAVSGVLAHAAWRYKSTIPLAETEIEVLVEIADVSWRPRLRELMRGGMNFIKAVNVVASEEAVK